MMKELLTITKRVVFLVAGCLAIWYVMVVCAWLTSILGQI